jgi:hypothetical protein
MSADGAKTRDGKRPVPTRTSGEGTGKPEPLGRRAPDGPPPAAEGGFRAPHLFAIFALVAAGGGALAVRGASPAHTVFIGLAIWSAGFAAYLLYRVVWPLVAVSPDIGPEMLAGRTRAALEREKGSVLRAIKELEFDRAMRKMSEADFQDMSGRLRARAVGLIKQLDAGSAGYRELIERELAGRAATSRGQTRTADVPEPEAPVVPASLPDPAGPARGTCGGCGTLNEPDARFCKQCGNRLIV